MKRLYPNPASFDDALFRNPTAVYRAAPFWAWNTKLNETELLRQLDCFKEMGYGGAFPHPRVGLATEYLGDEFNHAVRACVDKAKDNDMKLWLYDEDRYPSGVVGGLVTADPRFRKRRVDLRETTPADLQDKALAIQNGTPYLVAVYDLQFHNDILVDYRRVCPTDAIPSGYVRRYAICETWATDGRFNGNTYVDTMNQEAIEAFLDLTLGAYGNFIGEEFGNTVPAIFTDEPHPGEKDTRVGYGWTADFDETFRAAYGFDLLDHLPELWYDLPNGYSVARYRYYDHLTDRFAAAYMDTYQAYCTRFGIRFTGHLLHEDTLASQTKTTGEMMRCYRAFDIPGLDVLKNDYLPVTAKQVQSAVHQYGRDAMMSELYGVTGWNTDFHAYKVHGDWQAALGVTLRVPHLAWLSMKGEGKRDYPAPIGPQSPWWREYNLIEDHFARINTALTRGKPVSRIAIIHPIESVWLLHGPRTADSYNGITAMDKHFGGLTHFLLGHHLDMDYICEEQLPTLYRETESGFAVGEMTYDVVIVPKCLTLRATTVERLTRFAKRGGKVIFTDAAPTHIDGLLNDAASHIPAIYTNGVNDALLAALEPLRTVSITDENGTQVDNLLYQLRADGAEQWLFVAHRGKKGADWEPVTVTVTVNGEHTPYLYDTATGDVRDIDYTVQNDKTSITATVYDADSLLIRYTAPTEPSRITAVAPKTVKPRPVPTAVSVTRDEENVYLIDMVDICPQGGEWQCGVDLLDAARRLRVFRGFPERLTTDLRPWCLPQGPDSTVALRFTVRSEIAASVRLCYEEALSATLNGTALDIAPDGWFVDSELVKTAPFTLSVGDNVFEVTVPFGRAYLIENMLLIGDFDVALTGHDARIIAPTVTRTFGSVVAQGLPFYGGNLRYTLAVDTAAGDLRIVTPSYAGGLVRVFVDGQDVGAIFTAPYAVTVAVSAGTHTVELVCYGHRENTFGRIHNAKPSSWYGEAEWFPGYTAPPTSAYNLIEWKGKESTYSADYILVNLGLLEPPTIELLED